MRVVYVCKAVDEDSPTVATQVRWIRSLASKPAVSHVHVLTARRGRADLPPNVTVAVFGARGWPRTILRFVAQAARLRRGDVDLFFVAQGGPYPALLLPFKLAFRRPLYQWKAQPHVSARMRFYARYCDDIVFTATPGSFPSDVGRVVVVGHGIDIDLFQPDQVESAEPKRDLVFVGRIAPIKRLEAVIRALAGVRDSRGRTPSFDIVGPCAPRDEPYRQSLVDLSASLGLDGSVRFLGSVGHDDAARLLRNYWAAVNFSETAFDKAAGEAMATGLPVITTNSRAAEMLPRDLQRQLAASPEDPAELVRLIHVVLSCNVFVRADVGRRLRENIVAHHSLDALFDKILAASGGMSSPTPPP
ncbi:MAG: glycosyltransferase family 4 protein [Acidimicrobiia bacterium]